ncbi:MAG TPA: glycerol-3-phosphate 1-O-acyltransferase PlsY [Usitatibacter sp.]|jgi:glycerol-3-phosphate acyltransferase PlsY|nr:glycerol-3-phosphate 1-O-acyltransferase PlsY [Usitatibacter sp.]
MTTLVLCALGGYLAGSIPFAVLVSRALALPDPRTYGSGNIGATNVLRSGHRIAALFTLLGDAGKGWAAVLAARLLGVSDEGAALVGFAAFVGHVFPVWLRFRGGKGVATGAGVLIALDWRVGVAAIVAWLAIALVTRYSSLAAIVAAACAPLAAWYFLGPGPFLAAVVAMGVILVLRHHANIAKLLRGQESRIGQEKAAPAKQTEGTAE